jgi:hypothetical protein
MDYTVTQLSRMLSVSRPTIYSKLECKDLQPFLHFTNKGKMLDKQGLKVLKTLLSQNDLYSKESVKEVSSSVKQSTETFVSEDLDSKDFTVKCKEECKEDSKDFTQNLIMSLQNQIKTLEADKEHLRMELEAKNKHIDMQARLIENSQVLLRESQQKLLAEPKGFFARLFNKKIDPN